MLLPVTTILVTHFYSNFTQCEGLKNWRVDLAKLNIYRVL